MPGRKNSNYISSLLYRYHQEKANSPELFEHQGYNKR